MKVLSIIIIALAYFISAFAQDNKFEKWHYYINTKGEQVLKVSAKSVEPFSEGLARVEKYAVSGTKAFWNYAYINTEGKFVIAAEYERASNFKDGVAFVKKRGENHFFLINTKGERLGNKTFEKESYVSEGMIPFRENEKIGYLNNKGEVVVAPKYDEDGGFTEGYCCVGLDKGNKRLYGFIDKTGKEVIPCIYDQGGTSSFSDGLARVRLPNRMTGFINAENKIIIQGKYATAAAYREGFYPAAFGANRTQWGLLNAKNEVIIKGQYEDMQPVYEGIMRVEQKGKKGYLRSNGSIFIPIEYDDMYNEFYKEGVVTASKGDKDFIILKSGKVIENVKAGAATPTEKVFPFFKF